MVQVKFKLSSNLMLEIGRNNRISADKLVESLMGFEGFTLKRSNVKKIIDNLLYNNHSIEESFYDCLTGEIVLNLSDEDYTYIDPVTNYSNEGVA